MQEKILPSSEQKSHIHKKTTKEGRQTNKNNLNNKNKNNLFLYSVYSCALIFLNKDGISLSLADY
jgi:hypothetical protein